MRHLLPCPPCGRQGRPGQGFLAGSNTSEPRGSAPRARDHRGGDHPVPSRTRQLSPPSPRVLQREAAGGQGVALAEGAFRFAREASRAACAASAERARRGIAPCGPSRVLVQSGLAAAPRFRGASALYARLWDRRAVEKPLSHCLGSHRGVSCARGPVAWPGSRSADGSISRRRTRRAISLAGLFAFGTQGDSHGDVLRGRLRRTSPYRMHRGTRTRSLVRALSALSRWVRCIGPITLRVLKRSCRIYT